MNDKELSYQRSKLESDINDAMQKLILGFERSTGATVSDVDINSIDITPVSSDRNMYVRCVKVTL